MEFRRISILVGISIVVVLAATTVFLQYNGAINLLANLSELWLFGILLPGLSSAVVLIVKGSTKRDGHIGRLLLGYEELITKPLESTPTIQPASNSSVEMFQVSILPDRTIFHRGQFLLLRMRFKGRLTEGYRAANVTFSDKTFAGSYDLTTLPNLYAKGTLDGPQDFDEQWPWRVPDNAPLGRCELFIAPCTMVQDVGLNLKLRRSLHRLRNPRRIDLAKPVRQAVRGETIVITLVE